MSHQPNPASSGELAWPPYDTVNAPSVEKSNADFWSELSDAERQQLRDIANRLDAAWGARPGTALNAIIATVTKNRAVRP